jgi:hypothetical protein
VLPFYHMSGNSEPHLPIKEGSGADTCPVASDPASLLKRAPVLPRVRQLRAPPSHQGGLWCCHVSRSSGPHLSAEEDSGAATCTVAPDSPPC